MIRLSLSSSSAPLTAEEQHGLDVLLDLSRLVRLEGDGDVVQLEVVDAHPAGALPDCLTNHWYLERGNGVVYVPRRSLAVVAQTVGASVEQRSERRDKYSRVPPSENALVQSSVEAQPAIARAATDLRRAVFESSGRRLVRLVAPWPDGHRWAAAMTHDLDVVALWPAFASLRIVELAQKGHLRQAARVIAAAARQALGDPVFDAVRTLLSIEYSHGIHSTWFILCGTPSFGTMRVGDLTYGPESAAARRILEEVRRAGHELALHGSFATYDVRDRFVDQRGRLARLIGASPAGVRQHFLRMRPGATQRAMADAGFLYDSTFGFADRNGFRLGVADVIPAWDASTSTRLSIDEVPFVWMDRALSKYQGVENPSAWVEQGAALAALCRDTEGLWTGIWHPNLTPALGFPDAPAAFASLVDRIARDQPWFTTLDSAVRWRRARRDVRASAVHPDGTVDLRAVRSWSAPITLEDRDARVAPANGLSGT